MTRPIVSDTAELLYDELAVTQPQDEAAGWPLLILLAAVATAMGELPDVVRDTDDGPGWTSLMDPDRCPAFALPYLAQFAGVRLTQGASEDEQRAEIANPPAFQRGTLAAMTAAAKRTLTGDDPFILIIERNGSPYRIGAVTRTTQTPDPAVTLAALLSQKPAGLILTHTVSDDALIDEGTRTIDAVDVAVTIDAAVTADIT
jgi:hypothetical protein